MWVYIHMREWHGHTHRHGVKSQPGSCRFDRSINQRLTTGSSCSSTVRFRGCPAVAIVDRSVGGWGVWPACAALVWVLCAGAARSLIACWRSATESVSRSGRPLSSNRGDQAAPRREPLCACGWSVKGVLVADRNRSIESIDRECVRRVSRPSPNKLRQTPPVEEAVSGCEQCSFFLLVRGPLSNPRPPRPGPMLHLEKGFYQPTS